MKSFDAIDLGSSNQASVDRRSHAHRKFWVITDLAFCTSQQRVKSEFFTSVGVHVFLLNFYTLLSLSHT